jgi:hypothetical protein
LSFNLSTKLDHFFIILIFQLFLKNFFVVTTRRQRARSSRQAFCLLLGKQKINPYFIKKKIINLNENFFYDLKTQTRCYKLTHEDFFSAIDDEKGSYPRLLPGIPLEKRDFEGIQLYLDDRYFDKILEPIIQLHHSLKVQYKKEVRS